MKKIMILILCVIAIKASNSQNYIPIPMDSALWSVNSAKYFVHGDTVINSKTYSKVYWQSDSVDFNFDMNKAVYYAAIRNDTANKKVYGVYHKTDSVMGFNSWMWISDTPLFINCDTCELILYDFDYENWGDTITVYAFPFQRYERVQDFTLLNSYNNILQLKIIYKNVTEESYYDIIRKKTRIHYQNVGGNHFWIEGIGSNAGPFFVNYATLYQGESELLCFEEKKSLLYKLDSICFRFVNKDIGGVFESDFKEDISLFPNPCSDFVSLVNTENVSHLIISDILGRQIQSHTYSSRSESITVNTTKLTKGLYFIGLYNQDFSSKKVLKVIIE